MNGGFSMEVDSIDQERRKHKRKKVKIMFLIKLGRLFNGRGMLKDINQHGMCLMCNELFKGRTTIQSRDYIGESLQFMIPSERITIEGEIAWVNLKKGEGAIRIKSTSDDSRWQEIYDKAQ
jgi:hypothetical protein